MKGNNFKCNLKTSFTNQYEKINKIGITKKLNNKHEIKERSNIYYLILIFWSNALNDN